MTITIMEILLYALALAVLVFTPGPVVVATIAKTLASGWRTAMPLAAGVSIWVKKTAAILSTARALFSLQRA